MILPALLFVPLQYCICFQSMRKLGWNVVSSHILTAVLAIAGVLIYLSTL